MDAGVKLCVKTSLWLHVNLFYFGGGGGGVEYTIGILDVLAVPSLVVASQTGTKVTVPRKH